MPSRKHLNRRLTTGLAVSVASVLVCLDASAALAQQNGALEEIMVTARKVRENLQDTPISITALTAEGLERQQITSTDSLDDVTPNLSFSNAAPFAANNAQSVVYIRGIGQVTPTANIDPGVGLYIDDVYISQSVGGTMDFRDIDSVQVLRGPQGTLFGRNTIGGAVVITTKDPDPSAGFGGTFKLGAGTDNLRDGFIALNMPVSDTFAIRSSFGTRTQDGYVLRPFDGKLLGDTNTWTWTGKALWRPSDDLEVMLDGDYTHAGENGVAYQNVAINTSATFPRVVSAHAGCPGLTAFNTLPAVPNIDDPRCANNFLIGERGINNGTHKTQSTLDNWGVGLHVEYDVNDNLQLKSITAYRSIDWTGSRDPDGTPFPILHTDYVSRGWQFSQEVQGVYTREQLKGVVGLYYSREKVDDKPYITLAPPPAPTGVGDSDNNIVENHSWAVFSQWTYDVTDALSITLGGRYTEDTKGSIPDQFSYAAPDVKYLPVVLYEKTFNAFTGSASISYRWNENFMTYASFSQGFKGGGWNSNFNAAVPDDVLAALHSFNEEKANTYEIGFKADLANKTLRLNGSAFMTDYKDLQFTYRFGVAPLIANAGKASINGFELEMTWVPTSSINIDAGIGYLDDSIDEITTPDIPGLSTGVTTASSLPFTPEFSGHAGISYTSQPSVLGLVFIPRFDLVYKGSQFFDAQNTPEIAQLSGVTVFNLSLTVENPDGDWRFQAGVKNLSDEVYSIGGNSSLTTGSGYAEAVFTRGREFFLNLSHDF